jgi:hypothetical protein
VSIVCAPPIATFTPLQSAATTAVPAPPDKPDANIAVRADADSSAPMQLLRGWATAGQECVVIDIDGRYAQIDLSMPGSRQVEVADVVAEELRTRLWTRYPVSVLGFSHVPADSRSMAVGMALSTVAAHRARTGRPHWLMIDDAETVLHDPDIPPHALDLSERGHCLVMRSLDTVPDSLAASIDMVLGRNGQ